MKRLVWWIVGVVIGIIAVGVLTRWRDRADAPGPAMPAPAPQARNVDRGAYLARIGNCGGCHTDRGGAPFAGGRPIETPFGTVYASNLTPDDGTGIGAWSRADFWRALHDGRSRDGHLLTPAFPYPNYTMMAREDADAIYDYLRSLRPVQRPNTPQRLRWPYSTQAALTVWRALYFTAAPALERAPQEERARGEYLVQALGHCSACHTPRNALGANSNLMDLSGGLIPMQNWYAPSLTAPTEAGLEDWPLDEIERLLASGMAAGGAVQGPMAEVVLQSTQFLSAGDLRAMAVFLHSLPPTPGEPERAGARAGKDVAQRGAAIYRDRCASCHGDRGEGVPGAYPALAANRAVTLPVTANLVQVVLHGGFPPSTAGNPRPFGMPPFANVLSDAEVAAVLSHIRASWGNGAPAVPEVAVAEQRSTTY